MSLLPVSQFVGAVLLPPASLAIALAAALALHRRRPRLAMTLILLVALALYALSTPWVSGLLQKSLEAAPPLDPAALQGVDAIVVLAGGSRLDAPEYGGDTVNGFTLERLRYGVRLHRASGLPILVTGGAPGADRTPESRLMQRVLEDEYGIRPRWVEDAARTTWDNARLSAPLLEADGVRRIALVSHAWHLRRAVPLFEAQGLAVVPAGTQFASITLDALSDLAPTPSGLRDSAYAAHEWLGILWYKLRSLSSRGKP
jgi:uncharacterized SAM-binding protein YcdF (DUF218 family)